MNSSREWFPLIQEIKDLLPPPASFSNHSPVVDSDDSEDEPPRKVRYVSIKPLPEPAHTEHTLMKTVENLSEASLASFLPKTVDNSTLESVVINPPTFGHVLRPLTEQQLAGFSLQPGPLTGQYLEKLYSNDNQGARLQSWADDEPNQSKENMKH
ncbi:mediator of RNA polymerase II transcription subunit 19-like [Drosophila miranda]|uniref:mediator of RNA polymerase II transcription subunit 19-like n=1 Tax=Drosophila miranda TaxID=7229 RepID=UPI0007E65CC8|nr:mediator of RNA polymerase II transcription subunit 19-like [Drosophila miranda]